MFLYYATFSVYGSIEKAGCHFDRSVPKGRGVEKSIKKQIPRLGFASLGMTVF